MKLASLFLASSIFATAATAETETTHSGKQIGGPSNVWTASDSSEANRQKPKWALIGSVTTIYSIGLNYSLNPDNVIELSYRHDRVHADDELNDRIADFKDLALSYRRYFGGTFVFGGGLVHRDYELTGEEWFGSQTESESRYFHILDYQRDRKIVAARFTLGNQWQWENLILGVDWIVADQFLGEVDSSIKTMAMGVPQTDGQRNTLARAEAAARKEDYGFKKTLDIFNPVMRIGWAF